MLSTLRYAATTWVAKLLLMLLVLSFAVWGISGQIMGGDGNAVVTAGDTTVSVLDYRLAYDRQVQVLSQQFGQRISREQAAAFGVDNQVLGQLIAGAVLDEQARQMRLGVSRDRVAQLAAEDPAFRGVGGQFDRQQFEFVLRQVGMRPQDYFRNREQVAVRQQIVEAVSDGFDAPAAFLRAVAIHRGEDRTVEYLVIPRSAVETVEAPDDAALTAYFDANRSRYRAPEYRAFSYLLLDAEAIADPASITEEEMRQEYERHRARYTTEERRAVEQLVFPSREAAEEAAGRAADGATFEELVQQQNRTMEDVRLGLLSLPQIPDQAVAEAAFALEQGAVSSVVEGTFGPVILRVTEIVPETVRPFEEVADTIRRDLAMVEASQRLHDAHDSYEDARAGGDSMREAAGRLGLTVATVEAMDRSGRTPEGTVLAELPQSRDLIREVFETDAQIENPPLLIGSTGYVFYEVDSITAARDRELSEVRQQVIDDWIADETATRLATLAEQARERLAAGETPRELAGELGYDQNIKRGLRRGSTDDVDFGEAGVNAVFALPRNGVGVAPTPGGDGQIVFKVTEIFEPAGAGPESLPEQTRASYASGFADDLLDQLVVRLQNEYQVRVNQNAIRQALSF